LRRSRISLVDPRHVNPRLLRRDMFDPGDGTEVYHDPATPVAASPNTYVKIALRETMTSVMGPNADITAIVRYD
jgi:hypothetical protein